MDIPPKNNSKIFCLEMSKKLILPFFITSEFQKAKFRLRLWRDQIDLPAGPAGIKFRCDPASAWGGSASGGKGGPKGGSARAIASAYLVLLALTWAFVPDSFAVTRTWDGEGADDNWNTQNNWSSNTVPTTGEDIVFSGTSTDSCTIDIDTAAIKAFQVNSGYTGTINAGSKTITFTGLWDWNVDTATFTAGTSTVLFSAGSTNSTLDAGSLSNQFFNLTIDKTAGLIVTLQDAIDVNGDLTVTTGKFRANSLFDVNLAGNLTITANGDWLQGDDVIFDKVGTQTYTNNQATSSSIGRIAVSSGSTLTLAGSADPIRFATITINSGGTLSVGAGNETILLPTGGTWTNNGAFTEGTGTVKFAGTGTISSAETFYNLTSNTTGVLAINENTTVTGAFTVDASGDAATIALNKTLTIPSTGSMSNSGTITETGKIIHPATSVKLTDSSGTEVTSVAPGNSLYVTLVDEDENLVGSSANTAAGVTVTSSSGDSEAFSGTYILTETGNATETFRNSTAIATTIYDGSATANDGTLEMTAGETLTISYTDSEDSTDNSASDTAAVISSVTSSVVTTLSVSPTTVTIGDQIGFTATVQNKTTEPISFSAVADLPSGIQFVSGSGKVGSTVTDPTSQDPLKFTITNLAANTTSTITFLASVGAGTPAGKNNVSFYGQVNPIVSNTSNVTITVKPDNLFTLGNLIGKVFDDQNENGIQDKGEEGIGNIKLATQEGIVIITDTFGRYHIPDLIPGRHLIKIDTTTLPVGFKLTTEEAVLIKSTDAMLNKANFGVKLPEGYIREEDLKIPIKITVDQNYSPNFERKLDVTILKKEEANEPHPPAIHLSSNYSGFISHWELDFLDKNKKQIIKSILGEGPPREDIDITQFELTPGEYTLKLTVFNKEGQKDIAEFGLYVEGVTSLNPEIPQELKSKDIRYTNYSVQPIKEKFNIPLKGNTVVIEGETAPVNALKINGNPVAVTKEGSFKETMIMPPGVYDIPIDLKDKEGQEENLTRSIRVAENYFFLVALTEEEIGMFNVEGSREGLSAEDKNKLEHNLYLEGRLAYYLKAKIKGKYLITSSLDTDRERRELFKNLEPEKYYAIYGDSSKIEYDATDTQDEFYLLVEADKSYLKWGSYGTGITGTELSRYNRSVHGGKIHYESLSTSPKGDPNTLATVFTAQARQLASHDELRGTGGSLYYLKHKDIIQGSEKIYLETRDEVSKIALNLQEMAEGKDYEIDYDQGRIIFHQPVHSVDRSNNTIISGSLLDGNPVYMIADYEYENTSIMKDQSYGLRLAQQITPQLRLGTTLVSEDRQAEDYTLKGLDTTFDLPFNSEMTMEFAQTERFQLRNFFSNDGGLTFTQVSPPDSAAVGEAYKLALTSQPFEHTKFDIYFKDLEKNFSTTDTVNESGTSKYGAKISQGLTEHTTLNIAHDTQEVEEGGNELSDDLGASRLDTTTLQSVYAKDKFDWTNELRLENYKERVDVNKPDRIDYLASQVGYQWTKLLRVFTGFQKTIRGEENNQLRAGINAKVSDDTNLYLVQAVGDQGDATTIGIERIENETTSYYTNYTLEDNRATPDELKMTLGAKSQISPKTHIYKEDQFNTFSGNPSSSNIYGLNTQITDKWSADFSYEGTYTNNASTETAYRSGKIALDYVDINKLKFSQDFELRFDDATNEQRQILGMTQAQYQITRDLAHLTRFEYSLTRETNTDVKTARFDEFQTGFAYRPVAFDWFNLLTQYKRTRDISPSSQVDIANVIEANEEEYSAEAAFDIFPRLTFVEKYARRNKLEQILGQSLQSSTSYLLAHRFNFHLTHKWDLVTEYRTLTSRQAKDTKDGYILEIDRLIGDNLRVGAGYHFAGYDNDLTPSSDYKAQGFFVRFTGTFLDFSKEKKIEEKFLAEKTQEEIEQAQLKRQERIEQRQEKMEQKEKINLLLKEGKAAYDQKDYSKAQPIFEEILTLDPDNQTTQEFIKKIEILNFVSSLRSFP